MIQANELRIGNYYIDITDELRELSGYELWQMTVKENKGNLGIMEYQPVPITQQRLIDLGFEDIGGHEYILGNALMLDNAYTDKGVWNFVYENSYITEFNYIHQLQNLYFAITGKELIKQKPASNR